MKLWNWIRSRSREEILMIIVIVTLVIMIATRWAYISHEAGLSIKERFVPPAERADSVEIK
ncbi:MAG: hypothetical protein RRY23_00995 [Alistipes sp.]